MNDKESESELVKLRTGNIILKENLPPKKNGERRERCRRSQRIGVGWWV